MCAWDCEKNHSGIRGRATEAAAEEVEKTETLQQLCDGGAAAAVMVVLAVIEVEAEAAQVHYTRGQHQHLSRALTRLTERTLKRKTGQQARRGESQAKHTSKTTTAAAVAKQLYRLCKSR